MRTLRRQLKVLLCLAVPLALLLAPGTALAATATVTINATPEYVAISNSNTTHDFGVLAAGVDNSTANSGTDHFDITNVGSVSVDCTLKCNSWSSGGSNWTYGSPTEDQGQLVFSVGTGNYDTVVSVDPSTETLFTGLGTGVTDYFEVGIDMPTSFTFGDEQQTTLTVTATA